MGFRVILTLHPEVSLGWRTEWKVLERWAKREPQWGEASSNLIILKKNGNMNFSFFLLDNHFLLISWKLIGRFKVPSHRSHHIEKKKNSCLKVKVHFGRDLFIAVQILQWFERREKEDTYSQWEKLSHYMMFICRSTQNWA